jgi:hypothetical protein
MSEFIIKGTSDLVAIDVKPSKECKEYHENSCIQINKDGKTILRKVKNGNIKN